MINYIVYIIILIILFFVSVIAIKSINRGIKAKQNLIKDYDYNKYKSKKNINEKD
ncbi:MAG TPA: hypothetical protein QGG51_04500 [Candidatus Pelagibacter bacterium]|jgi:hypothetical protein|nr:hypothetical protein [Candidatus Pelagibacter bacterium]|tara:strand:+ start:483 stop:647 length:165 start_codon:yes stop_codon:yes gene_type:complete